MGVFNHLFFPARCSSERFAGVYLLLAEALSLSELILSG